MSRIIIAIDDSERSEDAVAFGGALARASGAAVTVAHVYPWQHLPLAETSQASQYLLEESERTIQRVSGSLRDLPGLEMQSLAELSPARGLQELAEEQGAGLVVVGSSRTGRLGRVLPGSTAERLLHGSPCPIAVVPHGYRSVEQHGFKVIACGWDGTPESDAALATAQELAERMSASLRVIRVVEPPAYPALAPALGLGYEQYGQRARSNAEQALERRMAHLPAGLEAESELHEGLAASELVGISDAVDLLVLGSRGYGALRAVLLGAVSGKVVREAGCPVIVVPNGAHRAAASVFSASAVTAAE